MDKYTCSQELNIFIGSWNVAGSQIKDDINLLDWLRPKSMDKTPDIYCIGLQEIVELNAGNVLISSNSNRVDFWKHNIVNNLNTIDK
jgi:inositol-1,4,5-trisphosphate 5-phosphatase